MKPINAGAQPHHTQKQTDDSGNASVPWYLVTSEDAVNAIHSDSKQGLSSAEVQRRQLQYGRNELIERGGRTPLMILWEQLTATMVLILITAAVVAGLLGDTKNAVAILAIIILYAILGFVQEYRAEQAIASLKRMAVPNVRAVRDGRLVEISARELVLGDIIQLETGNVVSADARLLEAVNLRIQEAALTGESDPVEKQTSPLTGDNLPLGDRRNMTYMGTLVTQGRGLALVTDTGMQTELGKIAGLIQQARTEQTPLQRRLDQLGKVLAGVGVFIALIVFGLGVLRGDDLRHMTLTAVSVAVAIVPEGLPAVVTITLAIGAQRMLRHNALIRKLPAVETLGSVTVICSDKTGTLTENRMTVVVIDVAEHELDLSEEMKGDTLVSTHMQGKPVPSPLSILLLAGALCNDAQLIHDGDDRYHTVGDPTEGALISAAARLGFWKNELDAAFPRLGELPFDSDRKRMTTFHALDNPASQTLLELAAGNNCAVAFSKGSVDGLLDLSQQVWNNGSLEQMNAQWRARIEAANERLASKGMRVLGVAYRMFPSMPSPDLSLENSLVFVGLFGMIDPPRAAVRGAVATTRDAGVRTVMITGDHPLTAIEIARQLGIAENGHALTGAQLNQMTFEALKAVVNDVRVFARVSPEHKLKIVQALQENGHIVSMTGDGINDAPALRQADIGVAMGITGTDVSKEAADLVLLDDNFATIVAAVEEGRTIYENIRKFVRFSIAGNIGKVLVMILSPFIGQPIPLLPLQLLWLNLLTDGLLGLGMGVEPADSGTMRRPPYAPREGVFSRGAGRQIVWGGLLIGGLALAIGAVYFFNGQPNWQTMVFTTLAFAQIGQALATRSSTVSLFQLGLRSNPVMLAMVLIVFILQLSVIYLPPFGAFFETTPLSILDLLIAVGIGLLVFGAIEVEKYWSNRRG
ncbi:MAG: cation-translocating P-type ATPase [Anaerolineaceae bacterium]|nr:cation-translocating P-type ATPase [Anaerolineaceae bacterium]